ncbi:MAG: hypothetical protein IH991_09685 [Planctomycetes bacterium]|nr:hypothetical protein [Planctomycetota bacterium]
MKWKLPCENKSESYWRIDLAQGEAQLHAWIEVDGSRYGVRYVEVTRRD